MAAALLILGIVVAVVAMIFATRYVLGRRRARALRQWANEHGWRFREGDVPTTWRDGLAHVKGFRVRQMVSGTIDGLEVTLADAVYVKGEIQSVKDGSGRASSRTATYPNPLTVCVVRLPGTWPDIEVYRRSLGPRMMRIQGDRSPVKTGNDDFDRSFRVGGGDRTAILKLMTPAVRAAHLDGRLSEWALSNGELLLIAERRLDADGIAPAIERLRHIAGLLGARPGSGGR